MDGSQMYGAELGLLPLSWQSSPARRSFICWGSWPEWEKGLTRDKPGLEGGFAAFLSSARKGFKVSTSPRAAGAVRCSSKRRRTPRRGLCSLAHTCARCRSPG